MPFYEYECPHCGYQDEVLQKISDKPLQKCPSCGKNGLKKLVSAPVFRLKGSGWYETDFKSDKENKRNLAGAEKEEAAKETKADSKADPKTDKADSKVEAKPETKPETKPGKVAKPRPVKSAAKSAKSKSSSRSKRASRR